MYVAVVDEKVLSSKIAACNEKMYKSFYSDPWFSAVVTFQMETF